MWGESPLASEEIGEVFVRYIEGKIPMLPWCETALQVETNTIAPLLLEINRKGFWTINSQPSVNGMKSDHSMYGWGGPGGRVYQKSYVEFFTSPTNLQLMINILPQYPSLTLHSIDCQGNLHSMPLVSSSRTSEGGGGRGVAALTWGVFPDKEILQPTIFDPDTFVVWSKEAFQLWIEAWAVLYEDETDSAGLIHEIHDTYLLVAIIDNDFIDSDMYAIFRQVMKDIERDKQTQTRLLTHEDDDENQNIGLVL
jgi:methylenetetrahydrofolate reductase (NADPH)